MAGRNEVAGAPPTDLSPRPRAALAELLEAHDYARDAHHDLWDFAVELGVLAALGLTLTDLRWLVCKQYVEHAREVTLPGDKERAFRPGGGLTFARRTCFVLTQSGVSVARALSNVSALGERRAVAAAGSTDGDEAKTPAPRWDPHRHELCLGGRLVKQFKLPSPNQETILMAFEEEGWPPAIDDPLPPQPEQDPKRRLHDTVKALNRNQKHDLIRFKGNGTGEGVLWELICPSRS